MQLGVSARESEAFQRFMEQASLNGIVPEGTNEIVRLTASEQKLLARAVVAFLPPAQLSHFANQFEDLSAHARSVGPGNLLPLWPVSILLMGLLRFDEPQAALVSYARLAEGRSSHALSTYAAQRELLASLIVLRSRSEEFEQLADRFAITLQMTAPDMNDALGELHRMILACRLEDRATVSRVVGLQGNGRLERVRRLAERNRLPRAIARADLSFELRELVRDLGLAEKAWTMGQGDLEKAVLDLAREEARLSAMAEA